MVTVVSVAGSRGTRRQSRSVESRYSTRYPSTGRPPSLAGGFHVSSMAVREPTDSGSTTGPGGPTGVPRTRGDHGPVPMRLTAATRNANRVPFSRPVTSSPRAVVGGWSKAIHGPPASRYSIA